MLVVDDEVDVARVIARNLRSAGFDVHVAHDRRAALEFASVTEHAIDLLITDVVMPDGHGPRLVRELRQRRPDLPVLYVSGHTGDETVPRDSLLSKPFAGEELLARVRERLRASAAPPAESPPPLTISV